MIRIPKCITSFDYVKFDRSGNIFYKGNPTRRNLILYKEKFIIFVKIPTRNNNNCSNIGKFTILLTVIAKPLVMKSFTPLFTT